MKHAAFVVISLVSALSACSPPSNPVGRGGFHIQVADPLITELEDFSCGTQGVGGIGSPKQTDDASRAGPPDLPTAGSDVPPTNMGSKASDGQKAGRTGTYSINCSVTGSSSYALDIDMRGPNTSEFAPDTSGETSLQMTGSINPVTGMGTGMVYVRTTEASAVEPNRPCTLQALRDPSGRSEFNIAAGRVDLTFVCPDTTPSRSELSRCESRGTITLDHCIKK
jgi:hypothetical protein